MNALRTNRRRVVATGLATAALLLGGAGAATAQANSFPAGLFGSAPATQTSPSPGAGGLGTGVLGGKGATGLPGIGLFKALFAVFGAVRTQVPTIAAPIIAQGVTDGTITPAEAAQLTALLAGHKPGAGTPTTGAPSPTKPSAGEIAVLRKVFAAVLGQLPAIAAPVLAAEVTAGDITQAQADMIAKILTGLAAKFSAGPGTTPAAIGSGPGSTGAGNLLSTLQTKATAQVKKATRKHHKHKKAHTTVRSHRSS